MSDERRYKVDKLGDELWVFEWHGDHWCSVRKATEEEAALHAQLEAIPVRECGYTSPPELPDEPFGLPRPSWLGEA